MLLSDRDINAEADAGRVLLDPYEQAMVQQSSIDVRLDGLFRVFENQRRPHIDPAQVRPEHTREVEPVGNEQFVLHPDEFVLGSTYEQGSRYQGQRGPTPSRSYANVHRTKT